MIEGRYAVSGEKNVRTIVFLQGLEIQQMFMRYVEAFEDEYRTLIIEYPTDTKSNDEQISVIHRLIEKLNIKIQSSLERVTGACRRSFTSENMEMLQH